jgi:hypothetical protein
LEGAKVNKPWFLRAKKLGDYSHLRRNEFNELRDVVREAVEEYADPSWKTIKTAAIIALAELAKKHRCKFRFDAEGGQICIYKNKEPVFALRIGSYSRHRVKDLLEGKALYRGIINIVPSVVSPVPNDLSSDDLTHEDFKQLTMPYVEPLKVFYYLLPSRKAGKWKKKEACDLVDIIDCVKENPGCSGRYIQELLNMSPNKAVRLLGWLKKRRILHRRGASKSSGWYLNQKRNYEAK